MIIYTGVGSRSTPPEIQGQMYSLAEAFAQMGFVLRSGAAEGADTAFQVGCESVNGKAEIYVPWKYFGTPSSTPNCKRIVYYSKTAIETVRRVHDRPDRLTQGAWKLHGRNVAQVLGPNFDAPSDFLVCWTKNGLLEGGTRTAIVLALENNIPVYNLGIPGKLEELASLFK